MNDDKLMRQFSIEYQYRSHGQHTGEHVPQPKSGRVMGPAEISGRKKIGGGMRGTGSSCPSKLC